MERAIDLWRGHEESWAENPRNAKPKWVNYFRDGQLPETLVMRTQDPQASRIEQDLEGIRLVTATLSFDYHYDDFPSEVILFFTSKAEEQRPFVATTWILPDGRRIETDAQALASQQRVYLGLDNRVKRALGQVPAEIGLFRTKAANCSRGPIKWRYKAISLRSPRISMPNWSFTAKYTAGRVPTICGVI